MVFLREEILQYEYRVCVTHLGDTILTFFLGAFKGRLLYEKHPSPDCNSLLSPDVPITSLGRVVITCLPSVPPPHLNFPGPVRH